MNGELLFWGIVVIAVGSAIFGFGPRLVDGAWASFRNVHSRPAAQTVFQSMAFIAWCQKMALRAFGLYGVAFGVLLLLTGLGVLDGLQLLDRIETWLGS